MAHVVTTPRAPFRSSDGLLEVHQVPALSDNLVWVAVCTTTGQAAVVDGPTANEVLPYCQARGITLTTVMNTHTHWDHIGVNKDLLKRGLLEGMRVVGPAGAASDVPGLTEPVTEGDRFTLGAVEFRVLLTEGHINGHVSFVHDDVLFCGDTLFAGGCGYLFDGPPAKMQASLQALGELPGHTRVCCAHEYTQDSLRFAWSVEPDNAALAQRIRAVWALRARGECSVPSTIAEERDTNPFMRWASASLRHALAQAWPGRSLETPAQVFAAARALKDRKEYKAKGDEGLPLSGEPSGAG